MPLVHPVVTELPQEEAAAVEASEEAVIRLSEADLHLEAAPVLEEVAAPASAVEAATPAAATLKHPQSKNTFTFTFHLQSLSMLPHLGLHTSLQRHKNTIR